MRIVFFGTPDFAVPTLQSLLEVPEFEVVGVVTQPDARRGRGNQFSPSPVKALALGHGLRVWQPDRLRHDQSVAEDLRQAHADVFVVVAYGQILPRVLLEIPQKGCINVHGSLLPRYRGAAPIQWALAQGETITGVTTMVMDAGVDTGDMLLKAQTPIASGDNYHSLADRLARLGADLLIKTLLQYGALAPIPQNAEEATYAPLIRKEDCHINWTEPAATLHGKVRGFYPDCFSTWNTERLKIMETQFTDLPATAAPPGTVISIVKQAGFVVQTGSVPLLIRSVHLAGKRPQTGWEFSNGVHLQVGDKLG